MWVATNCPALPQTLEMWQISYFNVHVHWIKMNRSIRYPIEYEFGFEELLLILTDVASAVLALKLLKHAQWLSVKCRISMNNEWST
jgi:hypothetical protein